MAKTKLLFYSLAVILFLLDHGASAVETDSVFVMEGDAVILYTADIMNQQDRMTWFFGDNWIAAINGDQSMVCTDDWCKERFRDKLELGHQTGSLIITNARTTDSGLYKLKVTSRNTVKIFSVTVHGVSVAELDEIKRKSVNEGESVTLESDETKKTNEVMRWYYNVNLIAEITGDQSEICIDDQCKERFRDRLELDHQTGSLTITNTRTTDSGFYHLLISSSRFSIIRIFTVTVTGVSVAERDEIKRKSVKVGESVTLESDETKNPNEVMRWYYNGILIAEITGDQSKICTDDQCKERFRDRLELDHQTGSLSITNTRTRDSGLYHLEFSRGRISIIRIFSVTVTYASDLGSSSAAAVDAVVVVLLLLHLLLVAAVVFYQRTAIMGWFRRQRGDQTNVAEKQSPEQRALMQKTTNGTSHNETEAASETKVLHYLFY